MLKHVKLKAYSSNCINCNSMALTVCTCIKNSLLQISLEGQIHQKTLVPSFFVLSFFDESLTKCESSSGRLLFLEIFIKTNKSDTLKFFMLFYLGMFS